MRRKKYKKERDTGIKKEKHDRFIENLPNMTWKIHNHMKTLKLVTINYYSKGGRQAKKQYLEPRIYEYNWVWACQKKLQEYDFSNSKVVKFHTKIVKFHTKFSSLSAEAL